MDLDPTKQPDFEAISLTPEFYTDEQILAAFRAGNIALSNALLGQPTTCFTIERLEQTSERLGRELSTRAAA